MAEERSSGSPIRVSLVAASRLAEQAVAGLLATRPGVAVAGSARGFEEARRELGTLAVDVVLIEPAGDETALSEALEWIRELAERRRELKLLPQGLDGERQVVRFLEAGAAGYALKSDSADRVLAAIEGAARGRAACAPRVAALVFARLAELSRGRGYGLPASGLPAASRRVGPERLSRREAEVLALLARGLRNKEIAYRLGIALSTAGNHVHKIFRKLGVRRRRDAVRHAYRRGLLDRSAAAGSFAAAEA